MKTPMYRLWRLTGLLFLLHPQTFAQQLPFDVGTVVNGYQDDFNGSSLNPDWIVAGADVYSVANGMLHISSANGDPNHLLYAVPGYNDTVQEVLARMRVVAFDGSDGTRGGVAVGVDASSSQGINFHFRNNGSSYMSFLDDFRSWGPTQSFSWQPNVWYWLRIRQEPNAAAQGGSDDVFAKIWLADGTEAEPTDWQLTWDYIPGRSTRTGYSGLTAGSGGAPAQFDVDYVLIKASGLPSILVSPSTFIQSAVTITNQPQSKTVAELSPVTFSVGASGNPPPTYQWFKNNIAVTGATNASYTLAAASFADNSAQFKVKLQNLVSNVTHSVTSSIATLTVTRDTSAPTVLNLIPAAGSVVPSLKQLEVHFSEGVRGVAARDLWINGAPATNLTVVAPDVYLFDFPSPANGPVVVSWSPTNLIYDLAYLSNHFAGGTYNFTLDPTAVPSELYLSEFMAANKHTIRDEDGSYSDWLEIWNRGLQPVNLGGFYLTDNAATLKKWRIPAGVVLASKAYLLVWASGNDRTNPAAPLHTSFKIDKAANQFLALVYTNGTSIVSSFAPYPQQYDDVSYGRDRLNPGVVGYFTNATPATANASLGPGFGPEVLYSVPSRTFQQSFTLNLSLAGSNAIIRYFLVTNGTSAALTGLPDGNSPLYTGPLTIASTVQVRARAFPTQTNYFPGPPHNETYFQLGADLAAFSSDLPVVVFHDLGQGAVPATADQLMTMQVFDTDYGRAALTNPPDLAVQGTFHRRGQSTFWNPKPNLRVETQNEYGDNLNVPLCGFPADNDWVFYGVDCFDKVLMHNPLAHALYEELGHYSPRTRFVEVFIQDGSGACGPLTTANYYGLYVLEEKIKIGKDRVDIDKLQPENTSAPSVTGGYLLSIDKSNPGAPMYVADAAIWNLDPDYSEISARPAQAQYIYNYFSSFYAALYSSGWTNAVTGYAPFIDLDSWIDSHLHETFMFNADALRISTYFHKPRNGPLVQGPLWDFDRAFGDSWDDRGFNPRLWRSNSGDGGTDMFNAGGTFNNPWYSRLFNDPDFFQLWIDRYQELRQTAYSTPHLMAWIDYFGNQVREATVREYARWTGSGGSDTSPRSGTYSGDGLTYTFPTPGTWQGEIDFTKYWFSNRVDFMDTNFLNPPVFSSPGGPVSPGFPLSINTDTREANSWIYYTVDGTDPRLPGGAIAPSARSNRNSLLLTLTNNARVVARNFNLAHNNLTGPGNPPLSSHWSGPRAATFVVATPPLRITEIMFNPYPPPPGNTNDAQNFEFIELQNTGSTALNLAGFRLSGGIDFVFPALILAPGQRVVVVSNLAAFQSRYGTSALVAGVYTGHLNNSGDHLVLQGPLLESILDFSYNDTWYPATDGLGFSLVIRDPGAAPTSWDLKDSWRASSTVGGSPGQVDPTPPSLPPVVISEALTHTDLPQLDTIEVFNPTTNSVNLGGWFLTDDRHAPLKYRIPNGISLPPGGYHLFDASQFDIGSNAFNLSSVGEEVYLFSGDATTNLTGYAQGFSFGAAPNGICFGRYVNSQGDEQFVLQSQNTLGTNNAYPRVGPVIISEIMYHPPDLSGGVVDTLNEYVELQNLTATNVPLYDPNAPTNTWLLAQAVDYTFPGNVVLGPNARLLVVPFDPIQYGAQRAAFVSRYHVPTNVPIYGPWSGHLDNNGERLELQRPDNPNVTPTNIFVPYYLVEAVAFKPTIPWPTNADGGGTSLQRISPILFANEPLNWQAAPPTAGQTNPTGPAVDIDLDGLPDEWELAHGLNPQLDDAALDADADGMSNHQEYLAGTDPQDALDFFHFSRVSLAAANCVLEFPTKTNRTYTVEFRNSLLATDPWQTLTDGVAGTGGTMVLNFARNQNLRFYRLRVTFTSN